MSAIPHTCVAAAALAESRRRQLLRCVEGRDHTQLAHQLYDLADEAHESLLKPEVEHNEEEAQAVHA